MRLFMILGTFLALIAYFSPGHMPGSTETYCEMIGIYADTGGEFGWPDYRKGVDCDD